MSTSDKVQNTLDELQEEVAIHATPLQGDGLAVLPAPDTGGGAVIATEGEEAGAPLPKLRPLIFNRDYMLLWTGQVVSAVGSGMSGIVFTLLILAITVTAANPQGDTVLAGLAGALFSLPYLLLSLPVGALIDRWNRKRVMIISDLFRAANIATVPIALGLGVLTPWQLLINAFIEGTFFVFFNLAEVAALPRVVNKRQLPQASAQNEAGFIGANLIGPPLGAALFQSVSRALPFVLDAVSYTISAVSLLFIKTKFQGERPAAQEQRHLMTEIREGLSWLWQQPLIRFMAFLTGGMNFVSAGTTLILILRAKELGADDAQIGLLVSIGAIGGVLGAVVGGQIQKRFTFGQVIITVCWVSVAFYFLYLAAPNALALGVLMAFSWATGPIYNVVQFSYRIALIPDRLQGRVNSTFRLLAFGFNPIGAALAGVMLAAIGTTNTIIFFGLVYAALSLATTLNSHVRNAKPVEKVAMEMHEA
jgi:predicted MFS family arabinose efflux permease